MGWDGLKLDLIVFLLMKNGFLFLQMLKLKTWWFRPQTIYLLFSLDVQNFKGRAKNDSGLKQCCLLTRSVKLRCKELGIVLRQGMG